MQTAAKNISQRCATLRKNISALRREAEQRGVPLFALRLLASKRVPLNETDTTLRYRRD